MASIVVRVSPLLFIILWALWLDNWGSKFDLTKSGLSQTRSRLSEQIEANALRKMTLLCCCRDRIHLCTIWETLLLYNVHLQDKNKTKNEFPKSLPLNS